MTLPIHRRFLPNRTHKATANTSTTTLVGPIPSGVEHVRAYATIACLFAVGDANVAVTTSGSPVGAVLPAGQFVDIPLPQDSRYIGLRSESGSPVVYVSELGRPSL